jgi:drug/metabolite transporter (DMT)-like permease
MRHAATPSPRRTAVLTAVTMAAFASNSILCRLALQSRAIDPASFTLVRVLAGAVALFLMARAAGPRPRAPGRWAGAAFLFLYAAAFSFAYTRLSAGTGALLLFGCVQATMLTAALRSGERPHPLEWIGLALAVTGLVVLVAPGLAAPSPAGSALMALAGVAWGVYSLTGRGSTDALADTGRNFMRALPLATAASLLAPVAGEAFHVTRRGVLLALASGALASGVGYAVWYAALRGLTATRAATVQLSVPVLAALGGVWLLSEVVTVRLVASAILILGGVGLALSSRSAAWKRPRGRPGRGVD